MTLSRFKWIAAFLILMFLILIFAGNTDMPLRPFLFLTSFVIFALFCCKIFLVLGRFIIKSIHMADSRTIDKGLVWFVWTILFCPLALLAFGGLAYLIKILGL